MSDIFDIPIDEKPKKKRAPMSDEAKTKLLQRLKEGRERAKAKRAEAKKTMETIKEDDIVEPKSKEDDIVELTSDYQTSEEQHHGLDNDDVSLLAREIEELETKVNGYKKREKKKTSGVIINNNKVKRDKYINDMVAQKVSEHMSKINKTVVTAPPKVQPVQRVQPVQPVQPKIKKVSKFSNTIRPAWARGFDI
tara:strand:+ start:183 stop:764 length:582 start_codon:yes stop_codon:yes gene_type:complete